MNDPAIATRSSLPNRKRRWPWFVAGTVAIIVVAPLLPLPYRDPQVIMSAIGGLWAVAFFIQNGHKEDARFMKDLFADFTKRYSEQNDELQKIVRHPGPFGEKEQLAFIDYFNLCAEEWVFWELGYIYDAIWESWANGMREYGNDSGVAELWQTLAPQHVGSGLLMVRFRPSARATSGVS